MRSWLVNTVVNGFATEIQNIIKTQKFYCNGDGTIVDDKIKCPSLNEIGITGGYIYEKDTVYPIFSPSAAYTNKLAFYTQPDGSTASYYWTRSRSGSNGSLVYAVDCRENDSSAGASQLYHPSYPWYAIACIRF